MTQKIDLVKYIESVTYISWCIILPYIIAIDKLFLYVKKLRRPGVFVSLRAFALVL